MTEDHPALRFALSCLRREHGIAGEPRVPLGRVVMTPAAEEAVTSRQMMVGLARHQVGDWGLVDAHDSATNDDNLRDGRRVLSVYPRDEQNPSTDKVWWIISELTPEGRVTTVLLPNDY